MLTNRNVNIVSTFILIALMVSDNYKEIPLWPYAVLFLAYISMQAYGSIVLSAQYFVKVFTSGDRHTNEVALTFDDGPVAGKTEKILEILFRFQVPAAFFCIGNRVKDNLELTCQIYNNGHLIGNHSYWHGKLFDLQTSRAILKELADTDAILNQVLSVKPRFFRPPYGVTNPMVAAAISEGQYKTVGWSVRSLDTVTKDPAKLFKNATRSLKGGDILLFHDFCDSTIEILPALIEYIQRSGFKIVRLDSLLNEKGYA
jgi:peptidoglycan-N-acetylglucosamine deacetylase